MYHTTQELLIQARDAYHALMTGRSVRVVVDGLGGGRVEYGAANADRLQRYISELENLLDGGDRHAAPATGWF